jgi:shikimate dehydrogenase
LKKKEKILVMTDNILNPLLAGVVGNPISQSKSPKLHNYWLKKYDIYGYYIPLRVEPQDLAKSLEALILLGFRGINITIPHKTEVLSLADSITDRAAMIGAANTLYFNSSGKITADNTDGYGFKENLFHYYPDWKPKDGHAVVFGSGGAAKAVIHSLLLEGVPTVKVLNRTKVKAEMLAEHFGNRVEVVDWYSVNAALSGAKSVINTTSLGMVGQPHFNPDLSNLAVDALVSDLVYNPVETEFLKMAKKFNYNVVDGLGMLLYQAEQGFTNWYNFKPEVNHELKEFMLKND